MKIDHTHINIYQYILAYTRTHTHAGRLDIKEDRCIVCFCLYNIWFGPTLMSGHVETFEVLQEKREKKKGKQVSLSS